MLIQLPIVVVKHRLVAMVMSVEHGKAVFQRTIKNSGDVTTKVISINNSMVDIVPDELLKFVQVDVIQMVMVMVYSEMLYVNNHQPVHGIQDNIDVVM